MADPTEPDPRLEDIQERVDQIRDRLPDNPGLNVIDEDDVPAYFEDDKETAEGGITTEEAERRAHGEDHGQAPG